MWIPHAVTFRAYGIPKPQGSKKALGRGVMVEAAGAPLKAWRARITAAALQAVRGAPNTLGGPINIHASFYLPRPKSHYGTGRNAHTVKASAPIYPAVKPDLDKLARALLDAVTDARLWGDDSQVVALSTNKQYANDEMSPGVVVTLSELLPPANDLTSLEKGGVTYGELHSPHLH